MPPGSLMGRGVRKLLHSLEEANLVLLATVLFPLLLPSRSPAQTDLPWKFQFGLASLYDDNILRYSERYLSRFDHREDPGRFQIESTDDVVLHLSVRAEKPFEIVPRLTTSIAVDAHYWKYARNGVKDWPSFSVSARQELPARLAAGATYSYLPDFYVRHYRDDDLVNVYGYVPQTFQPFAFEKGEHRLWLQAAFFQSTRVRATFGRALYYHNEHFTEYDSRNTSWAFDASHPLLAGLRLSAGYSFITSVARGSGQLSGATTGVGIVDASYDEDEYSFGMEWRHPRLFNRDGRLGLSGEYSRRCYLTKQYYEVDHMHAGRIDREYAVALAWSVELTRDVDVAAGCTWRGRSTTTTTPFAQEVSDEKNYRQTQLLLSCTYTLSITP